MYSNFNLLPDKENKRKYLLSLKTIIFSVNLTDLICNICIYIQQIEQKNLRFTKMSAIIKIGIKLFIYSNKILNL